MVKKILKRGDHMTDEDVYTTSELPTGPFQVQLALTSEPTNEYTKLLKQRRTRVEFRGKRCNDRWFPTAIHWTTHLVKQRNKNKNEIELQFKSAHMAPENQVHTKPSASTHCSPLAPEQPCLECDSEREPPIVGETDPIYLSGTRIFKMTVEDVYASLALLKGLLEVHPLHTKL
ncbi:LOW QUALITY PROTEIN: hypothetical protein Cgig2_028148 [Carnegiea gigantea]|uniref:Uncharacterized protein n=1 Tax=Carnegiea gigantea TaxID=171969 RepID=A0A9Q1QA20_9CARY|nr:LOW QUALITY PROTEIN: hypothetical protein Cgig2_028148 [Carnegiea gigantea]